MPNSDIECLVPGVKLRVRFFCDIFGFLFLWCMETLWRHYQRIHEKRSCQGTRAKSVLLHTAGTVSGRDAERPEARGSFLREDTGHTLLVVCLPFPLAFENHLTLIKEPVCLSVMSTCRKLSLRLLLKIPHYFEKNIEFNAWNFNPGFKPIPPSKSANLQPILGSWSCREC